MVNVVHCINHKRIELEYLYSEHCNVDIFKKAYFKAMYPLPKTNLDPKKKDVIVLPLKLKRIVGRPKKEQTKG